MDTEKLIPPDFNQCQTNRPNTWPNMPSFMTFGPVYWKRCTNKPTWLASDGVGEMTLCDECKAVAEGLMPGLTYRQLLIVE